MYCDNNEKTTRTATIILCACNIIPPSHNITSVFNDLQTYCFREYYNHATIKRY